MKNNTQKIICFIDLNPFSKPQSCLLEDLKKELLYAVNNGFSVFASGFHSEKNKIFFKAVSWLKKQMPEKNFSLLCFVAETLCEDFLNMKVEYDFCLSFPDIFYENFIDEFLLWISQADIKAI